MGMQQQTHLTRVYDNSQFHSYNGFPMELVLQTHISFSYTFPFKGNTVFSIRP